MAVKVKPAARGSPLLVTPRDQGRLEVERLCLYSGSVRETRREGCIMRVLSDMYRKATES